MTLSSNARLSSVNRSHSLAAAAVLLLASPIAAVAHDFKILDARVLLRSDATYQVDLICDLDELAMGAARGTDSHALYELIRSLSPEELAATSEKLRATIQRRVTLRFDEARGDFDVTFPEYDQPPSTQPDALPTVFGLTARLTGAVPAGASDFVFFASRAFGPVKLRIEDERADATTYEMLPAGARSTAYRLGHVNPSQTMGQAALRYLLIGFEHILPFGADHILFVLGLFLLSTNLRPLLIQTGCFTVAHTLTLALSVFGVVQLSPALVEPLIAASIVYVAVENICVRKLTPWRPAVVFMFGLLHGLGFAGALAKHGLTHGSAVVGLLSFNVGVELGQIAVIGLAFLAVGWFGKRAWYRRGVVVPGSCAVALVGAFWTVQRVLGY
jgi:hypothetical protein